MSTSRLPGSSGPAHPTRQQLDELDALLQRMLDLPVSQPADAAEPPLTAPAAQRPEAEAPPEEPPAAAPPPPDVLPFPAPASPPPVSYVVVETADQPPAEPPAEAPPAPAAPAEEDTGDWVPLRSSWRPSPQTWAPLAERWHQAHSSTPPPAPPPAPPEPTSVIQTPVPPASPITAVTPPPPEVKQPPTLPPPPRRRAGWVLGPLVGFNAAFDACLASLGAPGRWLASPPGRTALGVIGLACLAAALLLTFGDRIGWTR
jgi:hypothetical protein